MISPSAMVVLLSLASAPHKAPAAAGVAAWSLAEKPTVLLGGRLLVRLPAHANVEARQAGLMAAPESPQMETRVVMEQGGEKMVLLVDETLSSAPEGLRKEVELHVGRSKEASAYLLVDEPTADKRLTVISVRHPTPKPLDGDAVRVVAYYMLNPDGLLQVLTFFASTHTARDLAACLTLSKRVMASLTVGPATLQRLGGVTELHPPAKGLRWRVHVQQDYVLSAQPGPDFLVQRIWKIAPLRERAPMLGIYVGAHPAFHHRRSDATNRVTEEVGVLMGQPVTWSRWEMEPGASTRVMLETHQELPSAEQQPHVMHLWMEADTPAQLEELKSMALSMVLGAAPAP